MAHNFWTPEEDAILWRNAHKMNVAQLAEIIDRTKASIQRRASRLDITIKYIDTTRFASIVEFDCPDEDALTQKAALEAACKAHLDDLIAVYSPALSRVEA